MEKHYSDSTFLARWISGDLTHQELEAFKKSKDYAVYKKINETAQLFEVPSYNSDHLFNQLLQKQKLQKEEKEKKPRIIKLIPNWAYGAAASVIIALGIFFIMNTSHYETHFSEQLAVSLPDYSKVELNANSELEFKSFNWKKNREVSLKGEAFFDVEKGKSFKVITSEGTIEVLGTEFNVISRDNFFEVQCHEGKVKVVSTEAKEDVILLPGNAIRFVNNNSEVWSFSDAKPDWLEGESTFNNSPLSQVIIALENQFNIRFDTTAIDTDKRFTGGFAHTDLNLALKTVFIPMEISYSSKGENTIILFNSVNKN